MGYESISVTPVTPRIGAYVEGVTLAKPPSNRQVEELHQALAQHQVLFFAAAGCGSPQEVRPIFR